MGEMGKHELSFGVLYRAGDRWTLETNKATICGFTKHFAENIRNCDELSEDQKEEILRVVAEYQKAEALKKNIY